MDIIAVTGPSDIATVYMADVEGKLIEFVEALQSPYTRNERWILMVSTLFGCPVRCQICDAGGQYQGKLSAVHILAQIEYMVNRWYPDRRVPASKFKIQFARMGEPALNMAVLEVLEELPRCIHAPGLMPSISTIAPHGTDNFFERLVDVKNALYGNGRFQFQFSIHTTDAALRDQLIPVRKWTFDRMATFGERFLSPGDRKITLNFALAEGMPIEPAVLLRYFDPAHYLVKITPINPTFQAVRYGVASYIGPHRPDGQTEVVDRIVAAGYEAIVSIGEVRENQIGSNCGQYVLKYLKSRQAIPGGYSAISPGMIALAENEQS